MSKALDVLTMPLSGRHLIEASAGTGKTYNITRIYLRLLLEENLSVTQILVMTFTNAATQELRGRLTETLQVAYRYWQDEEIRQQQEDEFLATLYQRVEPAEGLQRLALALVEMDEAAIFTLHGFCHRILKQMAFSTGNPMVINLQNDQTDIYLQATADWFRIIREDAQILAFLYQNKWHSPARFFSEFSSAIKNNDKLNVATLAQLETDKQQQLDDLANEYAVLLSTQLVLLKQHQSILHSELIESSKQKQQRSHEWDVLLDWFAKPDVATIPDEVKVFLDGRRYAKKEVVRGILTPLAETRKELSSKVKTIEENFTSAVTRTAALNEVHQGIVSIKQRIEALKRLQNEVTFDDLISMLTHAVCADDDVAQQILTQFPAALIDEFQDTDAQQYRLLDRVYQDQQSNKPLLMMIGDPKQAIYSFRGGDIFTYLQARKDADVWLMDTNWRSVSGMVNSYNRLFWGNPLEAESRNVFGYGIDYEIIRSTPHAAAAKRPLRDPLQAATETQEQRKALTCVLATNVHEDVSESTLKQIQQEQLSVWCVGEIKRLLSDVEVGDRHVVPADIAILVRNQHEATRIADALRKGGLNSVYLSDRTPIFESYQAHELLRVLTGIWFCQDDSQLVRALSSQLLGVAPDRLAEMHNDPTHADWSSLRALVFSLRELWLEKGCMTLMLHILREHFEPSIDGERALTNYLHLTELLEKQAKQHPFPLQLINWLTQQITTPAEDEHYQQRLESDAGLIKIVTLHKSKGLEYPFVFIPFATEYRDPTKQGNTVKNVYSVYHLEEQIRCLQLGATQQTLKWLNEQEHAEAMRLLYVAITRAEYRCYLGIAEHKTSHLSALGQALMGNLDGVDEEANWAACLDRVSQEENSDCGWLLASQAASQTASQTASETSPCGAVKQGDEVSMELHLPTFSGDLTATWLVHSFSGLTRFSHAASIHAREWEDTDPVEPEFDSAAMLVAACDDGRFDFAKGPVAGNFLHDVLEHLDFTAPAIAETLLAQNRRYTVFVDQQMADIERWFEYILSTPIKLPHDSSEITLEQLPMTSTLREAEFYFPLSNTKSQTLLALLQTHRQDLVQRGWLNEKELIHTSGLSYHNLQGMMHGFIDLIFCVDNRYYVADYKSNFLGDDINQYQPADLAHSNMQHGYDLQYLIYAVALHRYLRNHVPAYNVDEHFGGVVYLYLRGMHPQNQQQQGVLSLDLPSALIQQLDHLFSDDLTVGEQ